MAASFQFKFVQILCQGRSLRRCFLTPISCMYSVYLLLKSQEISTNHLISIYILKRSKYTKYWSNARSKLYPQGMEKSHQNLFATYEGTENSRKYILMIRITRRDIKPKTDNND